MRDSILQLVPELVEALVSVVATLLLSGVGLYAERFALSTAQHGGLRLALWAGIVGCIALYVAYLLATDAVIPRLAALVTAARSSH